jgi:hypothetical protein
MGTVLVVENSRPMQQTLQRLGLSESGFSRFFTLPGRSGISYQSTEGKREFLVEPSGGTT